MIVVVVVVGDDDENPYALIDCSGDGGADAGE